MIQSKKEYLYYLEQDKKALFIKKKRPGVFIDEVWKYQRALRKAEYAQNCLKNKSKIFLPYYYICKYNFRRWSVKLGFSIPLNVFREGLSIAHYGTITVNCNARIGRNCRIQENVNIGATGGETTAPQIGDNIFIGTGAKIIGNIKLGNNIVIGANAVVVKSCEEDGVTLAGVPAKIISRKNSVPYICPELET